MAALYGDCDVEPTLVEGVMDLSFLEGLGCLRSVVIYPAEANVIEGIEALYSLEDCERLEFQFFST